MELGWTEGRNVIIDVRWSASNVEREQLLAKELVALQPDVILAHGTPITAALKRETRTIPIVFGAVADPVGEGFVESLNRPGGNITGFLFSEESIGGKWVELLKEVAPNLEQVAMLFNPETAPGRGTHYLASFQDAARSLKVKALTAPVRSDAEIESSIALLGREPDSGFVAIGDFFWYPTENRSSWRRLDTKYRPFIFTPPLPETAGYSLMDLTTRIYFVGQLDMSIASSVAQLPLSYPFRCRSNLSL